jgi:tRNA1(Val) A37 N6-methylase TrmN6
MQNVLNKEAISNTLGISLATVNNWIKTEVIPSPDTSNRYNEQTFDYIINKIKTDTQRLNSRANRSLLGKKNISYLGITNTNRKKLLENLVRNFEESKLSISDGVLALAITLLKSNGLINLPLQDSKIEALISSWILESGNPQTVQNLFSQYDIQNQNDDLLGAFYQSIQSTARKSNFGSYYTPSILLKGIRGPYNKTILDPCCGSGSILLRILTKKHDHSKITARDIDDIALKICHLNLSLFFNDRNINSKIIKQDIADNERNDIFSRQTIELYDYIVTNPPWGSKFSKSQKNILVKLYPELETTEIFGIALNNCIDLLKDTGNLYFFLPHAFLNVASHRGIRQKVLKTPAIISIELLGNAFKGVVSENILLHIKKTSENNDELKNINIKNRIGLTYIIKKDKISAPDFFIPADITNDDESIIKKLYALNHITLKDNAIFALGIVTGNNKKHILSEKTADSEEIFRGKDIQPYKYWKAQCFIEFNPEKYQQISPVQYYRQKKITYRFIGDRLVCALDCGNHLLLNSANLFISKSYPMETIVCLFNSPIYTFIYQKKFHSKKMLKSHLQDFPLPILDEKQHSLFYSLHCRIMDGEIRQVEIDKVICEIFGMTDMEYEYIVNEKNISSINNYLVESRGISHAIIEQFEA